MLGLFRKLIVLSAPVIIVLALFAVFKTPSVSALSGNEFQAGRIIDNEVFYSPTSMTPQQVEAFLNSKVPTCDTNGTQAYAGTTRAAYGAANGYPPPYTCLKDYRQVTVAKPAESGLCNGYGVTNQSSTEIIYGVAQSCGISPKALIVLLQKEQNLITDDWPWSIQYRSATGYGCPDTAPCDSEYYGFFNQVYEAARIYKYYALHANSYNHIAGRNNNILFSPHASCGSSTVFIQNQATAGLYNYTPYQPSQAALDNLYGSAPGDPNTSGTPAYCGAYGNRNFWRMFNDWFGITILPRAIKSPNSSSVYLYTAGYKISVPSMGMLQDYGINPGAIQTVDQVTFDAIPTPSQQSQISSGLSYIVKSTSDQDEDGGAVYLVSVGKKYAIQSMQQFNDFGFNVANISYLPYNYLLSLPSGGLLNYFVATPSSNVFQVMNGTKRVILDHSTFLALDPSGDYSYISNSAADYIVSGNPISNREILIRKLSGSVYLLDAGTYYSIPSMDVFSCWGFDSSLGIPMYTVADSLIAPPVASGTLSCIVKDSQNTTYLLNRSNKLVIPTSYGTYASQNINQSLATVLNRMPVNSSSPIKRAVKSLDSASVWWLENGAKKAIPSISNFNLLGLSLSQVDTVQTDLASIPISGIKLGSGQVVKTNSEGAVYVINGDSRLLFASGDDYLAYHNAWSDIESYDSAILNQLYPFAGQNVNRYLYDQASNKVYLIDRYGCYGLTSGMVTDFGQDQPNLIANQQYSSTIFKKINLGACPAGSLYVKQSGQGTVFWLSAGVKHPFTSWDALVRHNNNSVPQIIELSASTLQSLPLGSAIN